MKFKKLGILLAIVMCFAIVAAGCASTATNTDDSLQRVMDAGQLTVVGSGGYPPFNYIDENGNVIGSMWMWAPRLPREWELSSTM
jgi:ABC-type amino acid transport substrate-binding protein